MELKENWLTDGLIDFEYKKYMLLAYLKKVKESFGRVELYPFLSDLVFHYRNLQAVKENKAMIYESFPKKLSVEKLENLKLNYKRIVEDDMVMKEIESIVAYSMPLMKSSLDEGAYIYEYVESQCEIAPVGLQSLAADEGYLFIAQPPQTETSIYRYQITIFDNSVEKFRGIHTHFVYTETKGLANTYEMIKLNLIKKFSDLPNPATYLVVSKLNFPFDSTLMPVAKRMLVKQIAQAA